MCPGKKRSHTRQENSRGKADSTVVDGVVLKVSITFCKPAEAEVVSLH